MTIDVEIYIAINVQIFSFRIAFTFLSICVSFVLFLTSIFSAYLSTSAHSPYNRLNTIITTRRFTPAVRFKLINLIERLGGPSIATYCGDLFPINMFNFYLLVAHVGKTFFMILHLFSDMSNIT